jgi:hypothetical protein
VQAFPAGLSLQSGTDTTIVKRLFVMNPGTTALITIHYSLLPGSSLRPSDLNLRLYSVNATCCYEYSYSQATGVSISSNFTSGTAQAPSSINVTYTITAPASATGFNSLSFPISCPPLIPFAIVSSGQAIVPGRDFNGFFITSSCTLGGPVLESKIIAVGNMGLDWIGG